MSIANTAGRYGSVAKSFHWLTAFLIITLIPLGIIANGLPFETAEELARKAMLFSLHKTLGVTAFFVALARIGWALSQPRPGLLNGDNRIEAFLAETVHWLLYGSLVLVPLAGWLHHAATTGFAPIWWPFGQDLPFVPKNQGLADLTSALHIIFERVLAASILLHVAGALKHRFVDRDLTLQRMLPGAADVPAPTPVPHSRLPLFGALTAWVVALLIGAGLGLFQHDRPAIEAEALKAVESGWQVDSGALDISVHQFGSDVTGSFADWTAAISFDDSRETDQPGHVDVTIAIASLTLGSVTDQAMGPDFFDATVFPTAHFVADILRVDAGFEARGSLTIRDNSIPVSLPFTLDIDGDTARMSGEITLDRRDFAIGDSMPDEGSLGFGVKVSVSLIATRAPLQTAAVDSAVKKSP